MGHLPQAHKGYIVLSYFGSAVPHPPLGYLTLWPPLDMSNDPPSRTWGTNAVVLPSIETLDFNFLAPYSLCLFISALEMGIIGMCFARFLARHAGAESSPMKLLVYFVTCVSL